MKNLMDDAMLGALGAATDLPEDVRRTLGLSAVEAEGPDEADMETQTATPAPKPAARKPARKPIVRETGGGGGGGAGKLGTAGRLKIDVETLRRDSTHQLGHVIDEAIAFRLKRVVFEQKMTRGSYRTERAVIEAALVDWLDHYDADDLADAA